MILLLSKNFIVLAQQNSVKNSLEQVTIIDESVYAHCNATTFISGETLFYKIYALNLSQASYSSTSKVGYIELLDETNKSILKQKTALENGSGQGDFFISTSLKTGSYKLVAYTNWTLNKSPEGIFKTDIFIINPFESNGSESSKNSTDKNISENTMPPSVAATIKTSHPKLSLKSDKGNYTAREKVSLKIDSDLKGVFSISVRKTDSLPVAKAITSVDFINAAAAKNNVNQKKSQYLPELRGEIISGKIISKDNAQDTKDKTVALSIPGKSFAFKVAKTDQKGKFNFLLDHYPVSTTAVIQVMEENRSDYSIVLDQTHPDFSQLITNSKLQLNPKIKKALEERSIANQIENNYYQKKKDSATAIPKTVSFFHPLEKEYFLDDYTRFPSLKETITEVLFEMYYTKTKDSYSINLRDFMAQGEAYGQSLVMVDGLLLQDVNELFEYDTQNIYKVSFVNKGYVYGPKVFNGVINFVTKNNDYQTKASGDFIKNITLERPLLKKKYFQPDYSKSDSRRIPDFRYQLLWEPEITLEGKEVAVEFYTSDVKGNFEISLEGFTEKGEPVSVKDFIIVE